MTNKITHTCCWCNGSGRMASITCLDCRGELVLCILCRKPPSQCECAESRFDPVVQREAIDKGESF